MQNPSWQQQRHSNMWPIGTLLIGLLGWCWWTGKLKSADMLPLLVGLLGISMLARGNLLVGFGLMLGAGCVFYLNKQPAKKNKLSTHDHSATQETLQNAEHVLGLSAPYFKEDIDNAYRAKAKISHPDAGGNEAHMAQLNAARSLLLNALQDQGKNSS